MHGEQAHAQLRGAHRCQLDGVGNIVKLKIQENLGAPSSESANRSRPVLYEQGEADLHVADVARHFLIQLFRLRKRQIQCEGQMLASLLGRHCRSPACIRLHSLARVSAASEGITFFAEKRA